MEFSAETSYFRLFADLSPEIFPVSFVEPLFTIKMIFPPLARRFNSHGHAVNVFQRASLVVVMEVMKRRRKSLFTPLDQKNKINKTPLTHYRTHRHIVKPFKYFSPQAQKCSVYEADERLHLQGFFKQYAFLLPQSRITVLTDLGSCRLTANCSKETRFLSRRFPIMLLYTLGSFLFDAGESSPIGCPASH